MYSTKLPNQKYQQGLYLLNESNYIHYDAIISWLDHSTITPQKWALHFVNQQLGEGEGGAKTERCVITSQADVSVCITPTCVWAVLCTASLFPLVHYFPSVCLVPMNRSRKSYYEIGNVDKHLARVSHPRAQFMKELLHPITYQAELIIHRQWVPEKYQIRKLPSLRQVMKDSK